MLIRYKDFVMEWGWGIYNCFNSWKLRMVKGIFLCDNLKCKVFWYVENLEMWDNIYFWILDI